VECVPSMCSRGVSGCTASADTYTGKLGPVGRGRLRGGDVDAQRLMKQHTYFSLGPDTGSHSRCTGCFGTVAGKRL
jgi:hypothetical protein